MPKDNKTQRNVTFRVIDEDAASLLATHVVGNLIIQNICHYLRQLQKEIPQQSMSRAMFRGLADYGLASHPDVKREQEAKGLSDLIMNASSTARGLENQELPQDEADALNQTFDAILENHHLLDNPDKQKLVNKTGSKPWFLIKDGDTYRLKTHRDLSAEERAKYIPKKSREAPEDEQDKIVQERFETKRHEDLEARIDVLRPQAEHPWKHIRSLGLATSIDRIFQQQQKGKLKPSSNLKYLAATSAAAILKSNHDKSVSHKKERCERKEQAQQIEERLKVAGAWDHLRAYEANHLASAKAKKAYRVGSGRELRGWEGLREAWLKRLQKSDNPDLVKVVNQRLDRKNRGSRELFLWLADPKQHFLWTTDCDYIRDYADWVELERKGWDQGVKFTYPDPIRAPYPVRYGLNYIEKFRHTPGTDHWVWDLAVMAPSEEGLYVLTQHTIRTKSNARLRQTKDGVSINYRGQWFPVTVGGCSIKVDRTWLSKVQHDLTECDLVSFEPDLLQARAKLITQKLLAHGRPIVHISAALNLTPNPEPEYAQSKHYRKSPAKSLKKRDVYTGIKTDSLPPLADHNAIVMGVDIGDRQAVTIALYRINRQRGTPTASPGIFLEHLKSYPLKSIEDTTSQIFFGECNDAFYFTLKVLWALSAIGRQYRNKQGHVHRYARRRIAKLKRLKAPSEALQTLLDELSEAATPRQYAVALNHLAKAARDHARSLIWRPEPPGSKGGYSMKRLRLLKLHRRVETSYRRRFLPGKRKALIQTITPRTHKTRLLETLDRKIQNLRSDRAKKMADAIVKEALNQQCWIIAVEELQAFRPSTARDRSDNQRLSDMVHRGFRDCLQEVTTLHGIRILDVPAAWSSHIDPDTLAYGIRILQLDELTKNSPFWTGRCRRSKDLRGLQPGDYYKASHAGQAGQLYALHRGELSHHPDADVTAARVIALRSAHPSVEATTHVPTRPLNDEGDLYVEFGPLQGRVLTKNTSSGFSLTERTIEVPEKSQGKRETLLRDTSNPRINVWRPVPETLGKLEKEILRLLNSSASVYIDTAP